MLWLGFDVLVVRNLYVRQSRGVLAARKLSLQRLQQLLSSRCSISVY
jgi:hypothetical protein